MKDVIKISSVNLLLCSHATERGEARTVRPQDPQLGCSLEWARSMMSVNSRVHALIYLASSNNMPQLLQHNLPPSYILTHFQKKISTMNQDMCVNLLPYLSIIEILDF